MKGRKHPTRLRRKLFRSYLTSAISITLVLFLLGLLILLLLNTRQVAAYVKEHVGFTLILNDQTREVDIMRLEKTLRAREYVRQAYCVDKDEAASRLEKDLGEDFTGFLGFNPLFSSIEVRLRADYVQPDSLAVLEQQFRHYPEVREVYYQHDLVRLITRNVQRIGYFLMVFALLLLIIFIALINNTIRISIYARRFGIHTMQMVGATRSFIRRPFLWGNIKLGIVSAVIADSVIVILIDVFQSDFSGILHLWGFFNLGITCGGVLLFGLLITWLSTLFSVNKFLRLRFEELFY